MSFLSSSVTFSNGWVGYHSFIRFSSQNRNASFSEIFMNSYSKWSPMIGFCPCSWEFDYSGLIYNWMGFVFAPNFCITSTASISPHGEKFITKWFHFFGQKHKLTEKLNLAVMVLLKTFLLQSLYLECMDSYVSNEIQGPYNGFKLITVEYIFPMVILSEFRMGQHRDDDHWEDAPT